MDIAFYEAWAISSSPTSLAFFLGIAVLAVALYAGWEHMRVPVSEKAGSPMGGLALGGMFTLAFTLLAAGTLAPYHDGRALVTEVAELLERDDVEIEASTSFRSDAFIGICLRVEDVETYEFWGQTIPHETGQETCVSKRQAARIDDILERGDANMALLSDDARDGENP